MPARGLRPEDRLVLVLDDNRQWYAIQEKKHEHQVAQKVRRNEVLKGRQPNR
jgi:hypothetical protein